MRLNHNMSSLSIYNGYKKNLINNKSAIERLSTGIKINYAKDNPNKIGQSEQMRIQIKSLQAVQRNLQDGTSMLQTADGALQEANNTLARIKELSVSAANGSKSESEKEIIQNEIEEMKKNIDDLANNTEFNGVKLLCDDRVPNNKYPMYKNIVVGAMQGEQGRIPSFNIRAEILKDEKGNTLKDIDVRTPEGVSSALEVVDESIKTVSSIRSRYGAMSNRLETTAENISSNEQVFERADSNLRDSDIALEMAELARTQILNDTSLALISQSNNLPQDALRILERVR
ncbi:flagellin [Clostridium paraputrificum]|uniref:Flagellin n=2 Tax=Clostridium TaxID=1485 RepID=A0A1B8RTT7_9CLOT|nr:MULTISPECIES: flagellin [Clostridium]MDB2088719.1 flagellin [Clostridium paraputrificum]MDB2095160.1 flagellin [Clostridium paraputrificum]MDU1178674.1 flagellin [Clostridium sp.]MDU1225674.1 flagellin [Clostridium sp.]MDU1823047.1 flagellin [Clostridium sp.]